MAKDPENYYQDTPKQIRRKILAFKKSQDDYQMYVDFMNEKNTSSSWTHLTFAPSS